MRMFLLPLLIVILAACGREEEEVIDLSDIIPKSERNYDDTLKTEKKDTLSALFDLDLSADFGLNFSGIKPLDETLFMDRFGALSSVKLELLKDEGTVLYRSWSFKDSLRTRNAFYNWLDCFGPKCRSFKYLQHGKFQKEAMLVFLNDTSIIYLSSDKNLKMDQWQQYFEKRSSIDLWDIVVNQRANGKAEWLYYGTLNGSDKKQFLPSVEEEK